MEQVRRSWSITTAPASDPVSLDEVKDYLRISHSADDEQIQEILIPAATTAVQSASRRQLCRATVTMKLDAFPCNNGEIRVPLPPLVSVTSITYIDGSGDTQTVDSADYIVDTSSEPGRIVPAYGDSWPSTQTRINAVTVVFTAGYELAEDVPPGLRVAIKQIVGALYENRELAPTGGDSSVAIPASVMLAINYLIEPEKVTEFY